jgi:hypothetical protein
VEIMKIARTQDGRASYSHGWIVQRGTSVLAASPFVTSSRLERSPKRLLVDARVS